MLPRALESGLTGKRLFLTGGTGLFGKWLMDELFSLELELVVLTRDPEKFQRSLPAEIMADLSCVEGDIRNFSFPSGNFDLIVHAATPVISKELSDRPDELISVIVDGTRRVLELAERKSGSRLLYVSSGAVYGVQPSEVAAISESHPCNPISAYGTGKLIAESLCLDSEIDCVIARCFSFVGSGMPLDAHFAIGNFIGDCLRNRAIIIRGDGSPVRSYMHSSDLVEWLLTMLLYGACGEIFNVGSENAISLADLAEKVREIAATGNSIEIRQPRSEGSDAERYVPANRKAFELLSLSQKVDLDEAIWKTIEDEARSRHQ